MVDRQYSLNLTIWSTGTLFVYTHADLAQKYSVGLQEIFVSRLCSQEENSFFLPCMYTEGCRLLGKKLPEKYKENFNVLSEGCIVVLVFSGSCIPINPKLSYHALARPIPHVHSTNTGSTMVIRSEIKI